MRCTLNYVPTWFDQTYSCLQHLSLACQTVLKHASLCLSVPAFGQAQQKPLLRELMYCSLQHVYPLSATNHCGDTDDRNALYAYQNMADGK